MLILRGPADAQRSFADLQPGTSTDSDDETHWTDAQEGPHSPSVPTSAVCVSSQPFHGLLRAVHNAKRCMVYRMRGISLASKLTYNKFGSF